MMGEENFLRKIARLYYLEGLTLREIGERLSVSTATLSRSLSRARELGIVQISINEGEADYSTLEVEVAQKFGIAECLLAPSGESREAVYGNLAEPVSELLSRIVPPSGLLGVSWGQTLKTVAHRVEGRSARGIDVAPIIGAMGTIETGIYPNGIAQSFASALGGNSYLINAPAVLDSAETAEGVRKDSAFAPIEKLWERLEAVLLGASGLGPDTSLGTSGVFSAEELKSMRDAGAVCVINFLFLDREGRLVEHPIADRIINLSSEQLRSVPHVVVVAAGTDKVDAIRVALKSGLVNTLVSDVETADGLMG
jgi:DNA-binding transcriptional regulator LsrR (DeoR family)